LENRNTIFSVITLTLGRLVVNMTRRFPYPFLPEIARQLSVPLSSVQSVTAVQSGMGVISPLFGPLSERYGRKRVMMAAMGGMSVAAVIGALMPQFWLFAAVMIAFGVGKIIFDPVLLAYLGDRIPYHRRGLAIGTSELSWAGSLIVAAPLAGFLLERSGLQSVFAVLAVLFVVGIIGISAVVPADHPEKGKVVTVVTPWGAWGIIRTSPVAIAALIHTFCVSVANETFFINYGAWMESSFRLDLAQLGAVTTVIAAAEVIGEITVLSLSDRLGKRRLTLVGVVISSVGYIILPNLSFSLPLTLGMLFVLFLGLETAIVAAIPLYTEILPDSRSVMMSGIIGSASTGRLVGALLGGFLYTGLNNFVLVGAVSMVIGLTAFTAFWRYLHERPAGNV
jgi:predicted MFS family arabinose efflux permease